MYEIKSIYTNFKANNTGFELLNTNLCDRDASVANF